MINKFETPNDFSIKKALLNGRILVEYRDLREVAQGGPEIGRLLINGKSISNDFFGGPYLYDNSHIYIPKYTKRSLNTGFILCKVDLENLTVNEISVQKNLIYLSKIEGDKIYYYEDINKNKFNFFLLD